MNLQTYINAGFEVARLPDLSDLMPGRGFMREPFEGSGNVALRMDSVFVVRVAPHSEDELREIESLIGDTATVCAARFRQYVFSLPLYTVPTGRIGGQGALQSATVTHELLAPPSRMQNARGGVEFLSWKDASNVKPARAPLALVHELVAACKLPQNALHAVAGIEHE